jgi:hypothetical protein
MQQEKLMGGMLQLQERRKDGFETMFSIQTPFKSPTFYNCAWLYQSGAISGPSLMRWGAELVLRNFGLSRTLEIYPSLSFRPSAFSALFSSSENHSGIILHFTTNSNDPSIIVYDQNTIIY